MTKKEIVKVISERADLTQLKTKEIVQWTFDAILETLLTEGRIELRNFGVFEVKRRKARKARNPRTGERVDVEPKNVVTFQPGKEMEERVRKMPVVAERPVKTRRPRASTPAQAAAVPAPAAVPSVVSPPAPAPVQPPVAAYHPPEPASRAQEPALATG
jgi:nucleoid DNA-binding protein